MSYPDSLYAATAENSLDLQSLLDDARYDICVIGGGFTGVSSALHLAQRGYKLYCWRLRESVGVHQDVTADK